MFLHMEGLGKFLGISNGPRGVSPFGHPLAATSPPDTVKPQDVVSSDDVFVFL